jgi:hypothetical protein
MQAREQCGHTRRFSGTQVRVRESTSQRSEPKLSALSSLTLYPVPVNTQSNSGLGPEADSNTYHGFRSVDDALMEKIQSELASMSELDAQSNVFLNSCDTISDSSLRADRACSFVDASSMS